MQLTQNTQYVIFTIVAIVALYALDMLPKSAINILDMYLPPIIRDLIKPASKGVVVLPPPAVADGARIVNVETTPSVMQPVQSMVGEPSCEKALDETQCGLYGDGCKFMDGKCHPAAIAL